uniref:Uncharacterized protein n=1 Tax=Arundo donax TaxID=35708 RepID=A0A0A9EU74_ARUDO
MTDCLQEPGPCPCNRAKSRKEPLTGNYINSLLYQAEVPKQTESRILLRLPSYKQAHESF